MIFVKIYGIIKSYLYVPLTESAMTVIVICKQHILITETGDFCSKTILKSGIFANSLYVNYSQANFPSSQL